MNIVKMCISLLMGFLINNILIYQFPFNSSKICFKSNLIFTLKFLSMKLELSFDELYNYLWYHLLAIKHIIHFFNNIRIHINNSGQIHYTLALLICLTLMTLSLLRNHQRYILYLLVNICNAIKFNYFNLIISPYVNYIPNSFSQFSVLVMFLYLQDGNESLIFAFLPYRVILINGILAGQATYLSGKYYKHVILHNIQAFQIVNSQYGCE